LPAKEERAMKVAGAIAQGLSRIVSASVSARLGRFRAWPSDSVLIDEPLALAEEQTNRLRRIYQKCADNLWDGPEVFRQAVARHGGLKLSYEKRRALAYPISQLMWGELAAWIVSAELTERLDDPDARMAASSQVFDEARHFYLMRDYLAFLHVPVPPLDPFFATGARSLLECKDLTVKLLAMQIMTEGSAQALFRYLADANVEPVLSDILPYIERDEARHVGLGILHLPARLAALSPSERRKVASKVQALGDLLGISQLRIVEHYRVLGLDPREIIRAGDRMLTGLSRKLGNVPGTSVPYLKTDDPDGADYHDKLDFLMPLPGQSVRPETRVFRGLVSAGARVLSA
jgi:hypothetical protein